MNQYSKPSLSRFGTFRDLTMAGAGPYSDGGCLLGCTTVQGYLDPRCANTQGRS